jgi:hypothetical protein
MGAPSVPCAAPTEGKGGGFLHAFWRESGLGKFVDQSVSGDVCGKMRRATVVQYEALLSTQAA